MEPSSSRSKCPLKNSRSCNNTGSTLFLDELHPEELWSLALSIDEWNGHHMNGHIINGYHGWTWLTSLSKVQVTDAYAMHPFEAFGTMGALDCNRGFCVTSHLALANLADLDTLYFWRQIHPKLSSWYGKALSPTNGLDFGRVWQLFAAITLCIADLGGQNWTH